VDTRSTPRQRPYTRRIHSTRINTWSPYPRAAEVRLLGLLRESTTFTQFSAAHLASPVTMHIRQVYLKSYQPKLIPLKVVALFNLGYIQEAAELGFSIYNTRDRHPKSVSLLLHVQYPILYDSHRHTRYALFFHSLALVACIREEKITEDECRQYLEQVAANQTYIRRYVTSSSGTSRIHTF